MINSFKNCDSVTISKSSITSEFFSRGGGGGGKSKGFFFCNARDFLSHIKEARWPSGKDTGFVVW